MGKHKKQREQKQKIKLKVGRTLTKNDNVTQTIFKTKKIVLHNQIKEYVGDPENKVKHVVIDLLKCLSSNSNKQAKLDALTKMFSIVSDDKLLPELQNILEKLIKLMCDIDDSVREKAHCTVRHILKIIKNAGRALYLPSLTAQLSRAITDIHEGICRSSLKYVDLFLELFPDCLSNSHSLLEELLHMISRDNLKTGEHHRSHLLIFSPHKGVSALQWRRSVLISTLNFIKANVINLKPKKSVNFDDELGMWERNTPCVVVWHKKWNPAPISFYESSWIDCVEAEDSEVNFTLNARHFTNYINKLVPVLCDIFVEVEPSSSYVGEGAADDRLCVALVIVDIICCISEWISYTTVHKEILQRSLLDNIGKMHRQFFQHFPYSFSSSDPLVEGLVSQLNVALCKMFCISMLKSFPDSLGPKVMDVLCDKIYSLNNSEKADSILNLVNLLKILLHKSNRNMVEQCQPHLCGFLQYFQTLPASSPCKPIIWKFFKDLALDVKNFGSVFTNAALNGWFQLFVKEFIQISLVTSGTADNGFCTDILKIAGRSYPAFFKALLDNAESIISLMMSPHENVSGTATLLILKFPVISQKIFSHIATAFRSNCVSSANVVKLLNRLTRILQEHSKCAVFSAKVYQCFLLNVIVGPNSNMEDYEIDEDGNAEHIKKPGFEIPFNLSLFTIVPCKESVHQNIVDLCFDQLSKMRNQSELLERIQQYVLLFLKKTRSVSTFSAVSLLKLYETYMPVGCSVEVPNELLCEFANFAVACVMNDLASESNSLNSIDFLMHCKVDIGSMFPVITNNISVVKDKHLECFKKLLGCVVSMCKSKGEDSVKILRFLTMFKQTEGSTNDAWYSKMCMTYGND